MKNNQTLAYYEQLGGLLKGHFLLSSGLHSDTYLQSEKVFTDPQTSALITAPLAERLKHYDFTYVISPAVGGIRFGYELARQTGKLAMFTERVDGEMVFRRGFFLEPKTRIIIAEDVITTGKSTNECIKAVKKAGGIIAGVVSLIDRSNSTIDFGAPYIALAKINVKTWDAEDCPLCRQGSQAIKPGSRA